jgi:predicted nucleic acid-binding protein
VAVADIGLVEVAAAFAGKLRGGFITPDAYKNARIDLERDAQEEYVLVAVTLSAIGEAIELTSRYRLRGYDAVHLACAVRLNRALLTHHLPPSVFIASDADLLAALTEGMQIDTPSLRV